MITIRNYPLLLQIIMIRSVLWKYCFKYARCIDILQHLNNSRAFGPDNITPTLLKLASTELFNPMQNYSIFIITTVQRPLAMQSRKCQPIKYYQQLLTISLLSVLGKCMEKCVFKLIHNFIQINNNLTSHQFGFRPNDFTVNQLLCISDDFYRAIDQCKEIRVVFFNISKAFDKVLAQRTFIQAQKQESVVIYCSGSGVK